VAGRHPGYYNSTLSQLYIFINLIIDLIIDFLNPPSPFIKGVFFEGGFEFKFFGAAALLTEDRLL